MNSLTILIVDDIAINVRLLRAQLEAEGHVVLCAANGVEALRVLERETIDVIISDILMPEMDGYRLCYEVRRSARFQNTPFIFHTATYTSPADEKLSLELGADRYLRKPASVEQLLRAITEVPASPRRRPTASLAGMDVLKEYSERLVSKLEEKNIELTAAATQLGLQTTALQTAADAILITDVKGTILWINQAFTTMTGYPKEEVIGNTPRILSSGRHDAAFYRDFWETILGGNVWRGEFTNRRKDGSIGYDVHTVSPVRGTNGEITHFVGVMHDVTERRRAEDELRDTHAQLRQLLEHSPAVIYSLAVEGEQVTPRLVSENMTRLLGFSVAETMSFEWWLGRLHPEDRELATASVAETLTEGMSRTEYRLQHKDGSYRWVDDHRRLVRDPRGQPSELVGVWTDITERRRAQDERRASDRRFSDMLNNLQLVSMMLDRDARITYCNDYLLRLTGWKREELVGRDWFVVFVPPELAGELRGVFLALLADTPESWHHENEILTRSGERRLIHWNNSVLRSGSGEVIGTASIGEDITDRKNREIQFLRAQRLESLGTLAGGIAHDLNNLFMPILMGVTLIKRTEPPEAARKAVENIERCVKRGTDLVKQVLLFARGVEGTRMAVDLGSVVADVEAISQSTFPKNVAIATVIASDLPRLTGDPTQLTQVLLNLCVNARDALPFGGQIMITAGYTEIDSQFAVRHGGSSGGRYVVLEVDDNGDGVPHNVINRIFEPFFTTKEVGKGTGLGLSTAQGIVRSHGGFMTVSSEVGKGSTFKAYLPAHSESASATAIRREPEREEVLTAEDGAQGIDLYVRHASKIALVLTDMMMSVVDGPTLIAALRRINREVRIAASGRSESVHADRAQQAGTRHFLAKPFTAEVLLRTMFEILHETAHAYSQDDRAED